MTATGTATGSIWLLHTQIILLFSMSIEVKKAEGSELWMIRAGMTTALAFDQCAT
jgi:hypothetical protein